LAVVSADSPPASGWSALQAELTTLSNNGVQRIVDGASHTSLGFNPDHASQVSTAIRDVIEAVQTGQPLMP
jgi:hypothetical protein